MKRFSTR